MRTTVVFLVLFFVLNDFQMTMSKSAVVPERQKRNPGPKDAFSNDINACLFTAWASGPNAVLSGQVQCGGSQLCYGSNNPAQFAVCFNTASLIPEFTGHIVTATIQGGGGREAWHDEAGQFVPNPQSSVNDYKTALQTTAYPNFNERSEQFCSRGHLTPNADFSTSDERGLTMVNTNIAPQWQSFNSKNWAFLEAAVRKYAAAAQRSIYVFTGTAGQAKNSQDNKDIKLNGKVVAPQYYWKAVCDPVAKESIVFVAVNPVGEASTDKVQGCNSQSQTKKMGVIYCYGLQGASQTYSDFKLPPFKSDNCNTSKKGTFMDNLLKTLK